MNVQCSHTLQTQTHNKHVPEHQLKELQGKGWLILGPEATILTQLKTKLNDSRSFGRKVWRINNF